MNIGIIFALIALLGWGLADFLIEKSTRKFGNIASLFFITTFGVIILLPFVYKDIIPLLMFEMGTREFWILIGGGAFALVAALFDFEALRIGKIAVVEPIYALEIIGTVIVTGLAIHEWLTITQTLLVLGVVIGVVLISLKQFTQVKQIRLERGIIFALTATLFMTGENFLIGYGSRLSNPLLTNWVIDLIISLATFGYLLAKGTATALPTHLKKYPTLIFWVSALDTLGWVAFAYSTIHIPIGLATGISESYIALAVLLGLFINREKLKVHQFLGVITTVTAAIVLSYLGK